ncbi:MAG: hypothetical protein Q4D79_12815 [Propionibacteriaceae bacterium]|nr:hypothetical protein [Propionibacteriaceae bacterium]
MTSPTPRSAAPGDVQRRQAVTEAMASLDDLAELPVEVALQRLEAAQQQLAAALNPRTSGDTTVEPSR